MFVRQYFAWIGWTSRAVPEWFRGQSGATGRSCWRHLDGPEVLVGLRSQRSTPFRDSRSIVLGQTATGSPRQGRRWGKQTPIAELMNGGTAFRTAVRVFSGNKHAIIVEFHPENGAVAIGTRDEAGDTPLHVRAKTGKPAIARSLLVRVLTKTDWAKRAAPLSAGSSRGVLLCCPASL